MYVKRLTYQNVLEDMDGKHTGSKELNLKKPSSSVVGIAVNSKAR
jgi:hypothetical protein